MINEIVKFDGGLSTKTSPHLISNNEGIICENVNLERGTLYPLSSLSYIQDVDGKHIYTIDDNIVSNQSEADERFYTEYSNRLYWSDASNGDYGLMKYDGTNIGVDAEAPDTTLLATNITDIIIGEYTDTDNAGQLTFHATYNYAFTLVDNDGIESAPVYHPTSISINNIGKESVKISILEANISNVLPDSHTMNVYRIGGNNPTYNLINEGLTQDSGFTCDVGYRCIRDNTADIDVSRIELTTAENIPPIDRLDMLLEKKGTFWGAYENKVYFSRVGSPEFWGSLDYVRLDKECTGLGKFGDYILAFTKTNTYLISGDTRDTVALQRLPHNQGCVNKHTVVNIDNYVLWTSMNGICLFDGSNVQVLTKNTLSWDEFGRVGNAMYADFDGTIERWNTDKGYDIRYAVGYQDKYFGVFQDGVLILDLSNGFKVSTISVPNVVSLHFNRVDNALYVVVNNEGTYEVYILTNNGSFMTATWKTGRLTGESPDVKKHYRQVEFDGKPTRVEVFIDGVSRFVTNKNKFMLPAGCIGRDIQFEIQTVTEVRAMKYQYSLLRM